MHIRSLLMGLAGIIMVMVAMSVSASGAIMNHGDIMSQNYWFLDLTEDNLETSLFYGSFSTAGDTLIIDPQSFGVQVNPGPGSAFLDSELEMMIVPKNDQSSVDIIAFSETGDYTNNILAGGAAEVTASAPYFWQIVEVDGVGLSTIITGNGVASFTSTTDETEIWNNSVSLDLAALLDAHEIERGLTIGERITKVNFRFDNSLTAQASEGSTSFIKKKDAGGIEIGVSTVPEPSSAALLLLGVLPWLRFRR